MDTLAERLKRLIEEKGLNAFALSKMTGITPATISKLLNGKSKDPGISTITAIASALGVSIEALATGEDVQVAPLPPMRGTRKVPLISWVQAGVFTDIRQMPPDAFDWYFCPVGISEHGFCLRVEGESMQTRFQPGDVVFVDPDREWHSGSIVIVVSDEAGGEASATMKQLVEEGGHAFMRPLNPDWPGPKFIEFTASMRIVGVVIGKFVET